MTSFSKNISLSVLLLVQFTAGQQSFAAAPKIEETSGYQQLSQCEKQIVQSAPDAQKEALAAGVASAATGALAGYAVYGIGVLLQSMASSSESGLGLMNAMAGGGSNIQITEPGSKGLVITAVATGVTIFVIAAGLGYFDYQSKLAQHESLLQYFRDVKNGAMGPQIETRALEIQEALKHVPLLQRYFGELKNYSSATYDLKNISLALMKVGQDIMASPVSLPCDNRYQLSKLIDESTIKYLIEKYNPNLSVKKN